MAYFRCGGAGIPASIKTDMNSVLNKKFGTTSQDYPPNEWADNVNLLGKLPERTASGSIAHFDDGADDVPLKTARFYFNPVQAEGTPTPSSPISIYGHTGLNITKTGANMWGGETMADYIVSNVIGASKDTTEKTVTYAASNIANVTLFTKFKPNTQYSFFCSLKSGTYANMRIVYTDGTAETITPNSITVSTAGKSVRELVGIWSSGTTTLYYDQFGVFEGVLTAEQFETYKSTIYPVSWTSEGTIYGGYYDADTGLITKTWGAWDMGTMNWKIVTAESTPYFRVTNTGSLYNVKRSTSGTIPANVKCSIYKTGKASDTGTATALVDHDCEISINASTDPNLYIIDSNYANADALKASLDGVFVVYELETPETIQIDPTVINSYLGVNNIYHDANGNTDLTYRADIDLLISELGG